MFQVKSRTALINHTGKIDKEALNFSKLIDDMANPIQAVKLMLRPLYYALNKNKIVKIKGYPHLDDFKWIINENYGSVAYYTGRYEPEICEFLVRNLKADSCFLDIGAHAGYLGLFAAAIAKNGHVYSFEPEPGNFAYINSIKELNEVENWTVINKAAGKEKGIIRFMQGATSSTGKISSDGTLEVEITSIDEELQHLDKMDLVKIDVEGFGGEVIRGAIKTIRKFKPMLMIEIHEHSEELPVILESLGEIYHFKNLDTGATVSSNFDKAHFIIGKAK